MLTSGFVKMCASGESTLFLLTKAEFFFSLVKYTVFAMELGFLEEALENVI